MKLQNLFLITTVLCLFLIGCNPEKTSQKGFDVPKDIIEVASTEPDSPAVLQTGEKFNVQIFYELNSVDSAAIWCRPYYKGKKALGYKAHHLTRVGSDSKKEGLVTGWFFFEHASQVDEARIFVKAANSNGILREISYPVNLKWQGPPIEAGKTIKHKPGCKHYKKPKTERTKSPSKDKKQVKDN